MDSDRVYYIYNCTNDKVLGVVYPTKKEAEKAIEILRSAYKGKGKSYDFCVFNKYELMKFVSES